MPDDEPLPRRARGRHRRPLRGLPVVNDNRFARIERQIRPDGASLPNRPTDRGAEPVRHLVAAIRYVVRNPIRARPVPGVRGSGRSAAIGRPSGSPAAVLADRRTAARALRRPCWSSAARPRGHARRCQTPRPSEARYARISAEHLVALALHQLLRARLEVQPEQRLRVRRAHVHVPVVRVDRDAVEVRDRPSRPKRSFSSWSFSATSRDRRVELARQEVLRAERREDLRELLAAPETSSSISRNGTTPVSACENSRK